MCGKLSIIRSISAAGVVSGEEHQLCLKTEGRYAYGGL